MRDRIELDGVWDFMHTGTGSTQPVRIRKARVPSPWQAQFPDLRSKSGIGIYQRTFELPVGWRDGLVFLHFGAVFHNCRVWVNEVPVGSHEGGFLPFAFDVTEHLVEGRNDIKVRVESPTDNPNAYPDTPFSEIPFGKQSWYGPLSGIWQSVYLERRSVDHIGDLRVASDLASGRVTAKALFQAPLTRDAHIVFTVRDPNGAAVSIARQDVAVGTEEVTVTLTVANVQPWSPDTPVLYRLEVTLDHEGTVVDSAGKSFGFRTIETRDGRLYLNGKLFYLRGALDQDYYPDTICTTPSVAFLEDQFRKAKELGLNCLRCHIKAADPRYYEAADRIGLLVWTELPNGGLSTERSRARKEALLKGIVDRDGHHPSIVIWTIINENWGVDLVHDGDHRAWLKATYAWLKSYDPTRLVVDNSPLAPSFHVQTDIADYHSYAAIPDNRQGWDTFVEGLANRASWMFSPEGDAVVTGQEPLMCSEFGNWGLPNPELLKDADGREPWWFETGHDWGHGVMYPHGIENRFTDWHLDRVFGSLEQFVNETQWQQYRAVRYQIETMRRRPSIAGYVITELTDVHWEANGLLDMRRNPRVFHDVFHWINADTVVVATPAVHAGWAGDAIQVDLVVAHGGPDDIEDAELELTFEEDMRVIRLPRVAAGAVVELGRLKVRLPELRTSDMRQLHVHLRKGDRTIARNTLDLAVSARQGAAPGREAVWSSDPQLREKLQGFGYRLADGREDAFLVVERQHDAALAAYVRGGGRLLLLPEAPGLLYPFFPHWQNVTVEARSGTPWQGDWASSFAWLDRTGPFRTVPGGPLLDWAFERIVPNHVIAGCNVIDFHSRVHAGLAVGWIHKPVALAVERGYGRGKFVASTFRLFRDEPGRDPTAALVLRGLMTCLASIGDTRAAETQDQGQTVAAAA